MHVQTIYTHKMQKQGDIPSYFLLSFIIIKACFFKVHIQNAHNKQWCNPSEYYKDILLINMATTIAPMRTILYLEKHSAT